MNLLSIDFDFFFPIPKGGDALQLYDWGHSEQNPFLGGPVWMFRAAGFLNHGDELPMCKGWERFWDRFKFPENATLYFADSHVQALYPEIRDHVFGVVRNYDAHHDVGYSQKAVDDLLEHGRADCANWGLFYSEFADLPYQVVLPPRMTARDVEAVPKRHNVSAQLDDGERVATPFESVILVRSGSWTPSWCDGMFQAFLDACPIKRRVDIHQKLLGKPLEPRWFSLEEAQKAAEGMRAGMEQARQLAEMGATG